MSVSSPRIVIIGAGSLVFSSRLTADLLSYEALSCGHFALVDVDEERLDLAGQIVARILAEGDYGDASYSLHQSRPEALIDADFVIISILVGGFDAIEKEIDIPKSYGVCQAIGDTLTPGGIMRCVRTLPVQSAIARDVDAISPGAYVLNYTNPMSMLCWGMYEAVPDLNLVGLCHSVQGTTSEWARRLGHTIDEINFQCAGINHQAWITRFEHEGEDLLPDIRAFAEKKDEWQKDTSRMEYVKHFGFPVTEMAGHNSEYSPWFRKNEMLVERYCPGGSWNGGPGFIKELYDRPNWRKQMKKMATWETPVNLQRSAEYGSQIVHAIVSGEKEIIYGNVRNDGLIDNLPAGACVEVPCLVDRSGIQPMKVGHLPEHLAAINRNQINVQRLAVKASQEADPEIVFQAMAMDPLTASVLTLDEIRAMTRELLDAHAGFLPVEFQGKNLADKPLLYKV
jgi:alpha-galactosidase